MSLLLGFLPWILFAILRGMGHMTAALLVAPAGSAWTVGRAPARARILDWTSLAFFAILAVAVLVLGYVELERWMSTLSNGTLALMAWGGVVAGRPFTIAYAKEKVPQEFWGKPGFLAVNRHITCVWASSFTAQALSAVLLTEGRESGVTDEIVAVVGFLLAIEFTKRYPEWYRRRRSPGS